MNREFYILQKSLGHYFIRIDNNNNIETSSSCIMAQLFDSKVIANRFKVLLKEQYNIEFNVIKL